MNQEQNNTTPKLSLQNLHQHVPLTVKMVLLTIVIGVSVWSVLDRIQTRTLRTIFQSQLTAKLTEHSVEDRLSFDRYVNMFQESIQLLAAQKGFIDYIEGTEWAKDDDNHIQYLQRPVWFPKRAVLRTFIQPRFVLLLDADGVTREVYQGGHDAPPLSLLKPSQLLLLKSHQQSFMTTLDDVPYLITAESLFKAPGALQATVIFASPLDEELLLTSLGSYQGEHRMVILLTVGENPTVIMSSDLNKLPAGTSQKELQDKFLIIGKEFFDYGASELKIKLVSLASLAEVEIMTNTVISKVRHERATLAFLLILTFAFIIYWITRHINIVNMRIRDFSHLILGRTSQSLQRGDALLILKERFSRLTEEVIEARETIREQAEEKALLIAQNSSDAIITIDRNGMIKQWNPMAESIFGWSSMETVGQMSADTIIPPQYQEAYKKTFRHSFTADTEALFNKQFQTKAFHRDGHEFPVEFSVSPMAGDDSGLIAIIRDLTSLRKSEEELRKFKFISDNANDAHFLVDRSGKFHYVNKAACRMLGYSEDKLLTLQVPDVAVLYDIEKYQELFDSLQRKTIPPVETIAKRKDGSTFSSEITVTGYQINGEPLMFAVLRDISDRKQIEDRISFLAQVLNTSPISVIATDRNGKITYVNPATDKLFGYEKGELLGKNPMILNAEPLAENIQSSIVDTIVQGNVWTGELLNRRKDGSIFPIHASAYSLLDRKGDLLAMVSFQEDITERKNTIQLLEVASITTTEGKAGLDELFESIGDGISIQDKSYKVLYQNKVHIAMDGYHNGEYCYRAYANEECVCDDCPLTNVFRDGEIHKTTKSKVTDSGEVYIEITASPLKNAIGTVIAGIEVVRDITEQRRLETALRSERDKAQQYLDIAGVMIVLISKDETVSLINKKGCEVLACIETEIVGRNWFDTFIPERLRTEVKELFGQLIAGEREPAEYFENPVRTKNGEERIIAWYNVLLKDAAGNIIGTLSSGDDITERKHMDQAMRKYGRIVAATPDHISIINSDYIYDVVNNSYLKAHNKRLDQIIGHSVPELLGEDMFENLVKGYLDRCLDGEIVNYQRWFNFAASGKRFMDVTYYPFIERGNICGVVVSSRDITELKEADKEVHAALAEAHKRSVEIAELLKCSRAVLQLHDFETIAKTIYYSCRNLIGASAGYVALLSSDETQNEVLFLDAEGVSCSVDRNLPMPVRGLREKAYRNMTVEYDNKFEESEWMRFMPEGHAAINNVLFAPLVIGRKAVGLIGIANKPEGFNEGDASIALAFGEIMAIALFESRTMEALKNSERRFRSVVESASDAIISIDGSSTITAWNNAASILFGYQTEEILGRPLTILMPEEFRDAHLNGIKRAISTTGQDMSRYPVMLEGLKKDGSVFPLELSYASWKTGEGVYFTGIIRDITERVKADQEIFNLSKFPSENPSPVLRVNKDFSIMYANNAGLPLLLQWGCEIGNLLPENLHYLISGAISSSETQNAEVSCGDRIYLFTAAPVKTAGYVNIYGTDITPLKQMQKALQKAKDALEVRVEERTIELKSTVVLLRDEIINRLQKEDALVASQRRLVSIRQIGETASATLDLMEVLHSILKGTLEASGASAGMIFIKYPGTGLLMLGTHIGLSDTLIEEFEKRHVNIGEGLTGLIAQTGETIYIAEDSSHDPRIERPVIEAEGLNSFIGVPVYAENEIVAVMNVLSRPPVKLKEDEINLISSIGLHVGSAIKNAWLFEERKKAEELVRLSLREKEVMLQEIHHRVKNNLQVISSLFSLQNRFVRDMETSKLLRDCQSRIKAMALVHEKLYQSETLAHIKIKEYISDMTSNLLSFHELDPAKINLTLDIDNITLDVNTAIPCGLILNELITNSLMHAFPGDRKGIIHISARLKDKDEITLIVSDNGIGLPEDIDVSTIESLGLIIIETLINQLNGNIEIDRSNGTKFHIIFRRKNEF